MNMILYIRLSEPTLKGNMLKTLLYRIFSIKVICPYCGKDTFKSERGLNKHLIESPTCRKIRAEEYKLNHYPNKWEIK